MSVRILGPCPKCGTEDSIEADRDSRETWKEAACESCGQTWPDYFELRRAHEELTVVDVSVNQVCALVQSPYDLYERPFARLIVTVLNVAIMERFKLRTCFATEGGVQGRVDGHHLELRNGDCEVGLYLESDYYITDGPPQEVLAWYGRLLEWLFQRELSVDGESFGRGAILKLDPEDSRYWQKTNTLLALALQAHTGSEGFAKAVFERVPVEASVLGANYVAGLTSEDVMRLFVPPPGLGFEPEEPTTPSGDDSDTVN